MQWRVGGSLVCPKFVCCVPLCRDQLAQEQPQKGNNYNSLPCVCVSLLHLEGKQRFVWCGAQDWTRGQCTYRGRIGLITRFYDEQTGPAFSGAVSRKWCSFLCHVLAMPPKGRVRTVVTSTVARRVCFGVTVVDPCNFTQL